MEIKFLNRNIVDLTFKFLALCFVIYQSISVYFLSSWLSSASASKLFVTTLADDSFYYLLIAWRWGNGEPSTFDGLHLTSGYQPLWELVLALIAYFSSSQEAFLSATVVFSGFCWATTTLLVSLYVYLLSKSVLAAVISQTVLTSGLLIFKNSMLLMENAIGFPVLISVLILLQIVIKVERGKFRTICFVLLSLLLVTLPIIRVDYVVFVVFVAFGLLFRFRKIIFVMIMVLPSALVFITYLLLNQFLLGGWEPISGFVKQHLYVANFIDSQTFSGRLVAYFEAIMQLFENLRRLVFAHYFEAGNEFLIGSLTAALVLSFSYYAFLASRNGFQRLFNELSNSFVKSSFFVLCAYVFVHVIILAVALPNFINGSSWYFSPEILLLSIAIGLIAGSWLGKAGLPSIFIVLGILVTIFVSIGANNSRSSYEKIIIFELNRWEIPEDNERLLTVKSAQTLKMLGGVSAAYNSGALGWFAYPTTVINLDGLVNDYEYWNCCLEYLDSARGRTGSYLLENKVQYFADVMNTGGNPDEITEMLGNKLGFVPGGLSLYWAKQTDYSSKFVYVDNKAVVEVCPAQFRAIIRIDPDATIESQSLVVSKPGEYSPLGRITTYCKN